MSVMTATHAPHWTHFPAEAISGIDWTDHVAAHRAVMRLFATDLGGDERARRSAANILYRVDGQPDGRLTVLVQSDRAGELLPAAGQAKTVPEAAWSFQPGQQIMFRLAVCPVTRHTDKAGPKRREIVSAVPLAEVPAWLTARLGAAVEHVKTLNHIRTSTTTCAKKQTGGIPPKVIIDTIDALATVKNPEAFKTLRRGGVGRFRAYGVGLLTARPL